MWPALPFTVRCQYSVPGGETEAHDLLKTTWVYMSSGVSHQEGSDASHRGPAGLLLCLSRRFHSAHSCHGGVVGFEPGGPVPSLWPVGLGIVTANAPPGGHQVKWRQLCQTWSGIRGGEARRGWLGGSPSPCEWVGRLLPTLHREKRLPLSKVFLFPVGLPVAAADPPGAWEPVNRCDSAREWPRPCRGPRSPSHLMSYD